MKYSSTPSANKKDMIRNPEDRTETSLAYYNYEHLNDKHLALVKAKRVIQQDQWKEEDSMVLSECTPGDVVVCSLFTNKKPFFTLVQLENVSPISYAIDDASPYNGHVDDTDQWVQGVVVSAPDSKRPRHLKRTLERVVVPVRSLRERLSDDTVHKRDPVAAANAIDDDPMDSTPIADDNMRLPTTGGETAETTDNISHPTPSATRPSSWKIPRIQIGMFAACAMLWNMALGIFWAAKPYNVRKGTRETCLCQYHLRWDFMVHIQHTYTAMCAHTLTHTRTRSRT